MKLALARLIVLCAIGGYVIEVVRLAHGLLELDRERTAEFLRRMELTNETHIEVDGAVAP